MVQELTEFVNQYSKLLGVFLILDEGAKLVPGVIATPRDVGGRRIFVYEQSTPESADRKPLEWRVPFRHARSY